MKKFLLKLGLYIVIVVVIISGLIFFAKSRGPKTFFFVSNSVSHNLKTGFIKNNPSRYSNAKIFVIGSSMSLNNVNAAMVEDSLHKQTFNLASWGLRLSNFKDAAVWHEDKLLIYNTQFPDFKPSDIEFKQGYTFNVSKATELFNIFTDFKTYLNQQKIAKNLVEHITDQDYDYCTFDTCGTVLLNPHGFHTRPQRWNQDEYKEINFNESMLNKLVNEMKEAIGSKPNKVRVLLAFSPCRKGFYKVERARYVAKLDSMLKKSCPNVFFLNAYHENYPDSLFVDGCHLNRNGANKFTQQIIDTIRARKIAY